MDSLPTLVSAAYLGAAVLFILSLGGLSSQETARRGNVYGMAGMAVALLAVLASTSIGGASPAYLPMVAAVVVGGALGAVAAARVAMTSMPQLVAALHSFVGLAAVLVGVSTYLHPSHAAGGSEVVALLEIYADVCLGAITFTGSVVAWGKLQGTISGKSVLIPGRHVVNAAMVLAIVGLAVPFVGDGMVTASGDAPGLIWLLAMAVLAAVLGIHAVLAIGGADMPV
ncbi:MAG TPA: NAD(P) transhydrogenase subunit beta, partial [Deltaproteobacteria bacterium]|nr:NAD(P) transhydrogenase subunit beta [Deltaproteobacteria bacterium]